MPKGPKTKNRPAKSRAQTSAKRGGSGTSRHKARGGGQRGGGTRRGGLSEGSSSRSPGQSKNVGRPGGENAGGVDAFGESNIRGEP